MASEGYVFHTYGPERYLRQAVASAVTLRRHDTARPVALYAAPDHVKLLRQQGLDRLFTQVEELPEAHQSIVGFKHHLHTFKPFDRTLFIDADIVWCRDPDPLWQQFGAFRFTITGLQHADFFFGGPKDARILLDVLLNRRRRTMRRFALTHLPRVQAGMIYAADTELTREVCEQAARFLDRRDETHFRSRLDEGGRSEETCEWSLAVAMSRLKVPVFPWFQGYNSPQLDFIESLTDYDLNFRHVSCRFYCDAFVYALRGIETDWLREGLIGLFTRLPGANDYMDVTPYALHFGWLHQKQPFNDFAARTWARLTSRQEQAKLLARG